jgi:hypothetical protein
MRVLFVVVAAVVVVDIVGRRIHIYERYRSY